MIAILYVLFVFGCSAAPSQIPQSNEISSEAEIVSSSQGEASDTRETIELLLMPITKEKYVPLFDSELAVGGAKKLPEYVMETAKSWKI